MEHQSHHPSEIIPERNWNSFETSSFTNDYHGPQHISYYLSLEVLIKVTQS